MLFNSFSYALFLPIVFILYWVVTKNNRRTQNILLLIASYFFYSCWDYRFLLLLFFSTCLDYFTGLKIDQSQKRPVRKAWLLVSIIINLGFLGFFKYYNFFVENFALLWQNSFGYKPSIWTLNIILPVGISFYTFHGLSYVFDIYNKKIKPTTNFIDYSLFVGFFPLLVAGPIERATHLLPQIQTGRKFDYTKAVDGLRQILWGLFKKMVIADTAAIYVNDIFNHLDEYSGSTLLLGAIVFSIQIYCDFSGYSDIALGSARLLGFELLRNFSFPYFSRDIAEFWRRWHISLTTWFRDYLYIPLGGSRGNNWKKIRNIFIVFLISGLWHGANWTFVFWGLLNALFFLPLLLRNTNRKNLDIVAQGKLLPSIKDVSKMLLTFLLVTLGWVFFRAENIHQAFSYISRMCSTSFFSPPEIVSPKLLVLIPLFILIEWLGREQKYAIANIEFKWNKLVRWTFYYLLIVAILSYAHKSNEFIYFQF